MCQASSHLSTMEACNVTCRVTLLSERPSAGVLRKLGEGTLVQVSSSSPDCGSKLQGPFQNNPRVASNQGVNLTTLNCTSQAKPGCDTYQTKPRLQAQRGMFLLLGH
ncbi:hypothetical protein AVEN_127292-1 [Araneus ventricosus]|uniref:Uncharacterized protein n=1 Tax=Araneus ventricosus TaxID=182803 RepID=A0A4Y2L2W3_ARAVE|nr:hypothetical protein AVEN_127292-1 [Araneus ventricosus]